MSFGLCAKVRLLRAVAIDVAPRPLALAGGGGGSLLQLPQADLRSGGSKSKASRSGLLAKCFLGGFGHRGQRTIIFLKMCGFLALVLQASPKTLGQTTTSGSL